MVFERDGSAMLKCLGSELQPLVDSLALLRGELSGSREDMRLQVDRSDEQLESIRLTFFGAGANEFILATAAQTAATRLQREISVCRLLQQSLQSTPFSPTKASSTFASLTFLSGSTVEIPLSVADRVATLRQSLETALPPPPGSTYQLVVGTRILQDADVLEDNDLTRITVVVRNVPKEAVEDFPLSDLEYECFAGYCDCKCKECHDNVGMCCAWFPLAHN